MGIHKCHIWTDTRLSGYQVKFAMKIIDYYSETKKQDASEMSNVLDWRAMK